MLTRLARVASRAPMYVALEYMAVSVAKRLTTCRVRQNFGEMS